VRLRGVSVVASFTGLLAVAAIVAAQQNALQQPQPLPGNAGRQAAGRAAAGPNFPQQTRKLASPEVITRGKALFEVNCTACHGKDLRGGDMGGPSLLRSQVALDDQHGEVIGPIVHGSRQANGMPAFNFTEEDTTAIAEYIHSVLAGVGRQGRPPGADDVPDLQVIVGNPGAGQTYFQSNCASCHSATGDLAGIAGKITDPRNLQNSWVSGIVATGGGFGGGFAAGPPPGSTAKVTLPDGKSVEGKLITANEFVVELMVNGVRQSYERDNGVPKVEIHEPNEAHKKLAMTLTDNDMHNVTAYLATLK